ncbi:MAG: hypothetical protein AAB547_02895 [Patescibacteria group bacterium]
MGESGPFKKIESGSEFERLGYASQEAMDVDLAMKTLKELVDHYDIVESVGSPMGETVGYDIQTLEAAIETVEKNKHMFFEDEEGPARDSLLIRSRELLAKLR